MRLGISNTSPGTPIAKSIVQISKSLGNSLHPDKDLIKAGFGVVTRGLSMNSLGLGRISTYGFFAGLGVISICSTYVGCDFK